MAKTFRPNTTRTLPFAFATREEARRFVRRNKTKLSMRVRPKTEWVVQYSTAGTN